MDHDRPLLVTIECADSAHDWAYVRTTDFGGRRCARATRILGPLLRQGFWVMTKIATLRCSLGSRHEGHVATVGGRCALTGTTSILWARQSASQVRQSTSVATEDSLSR